MAMIFLKSIVVLAITAACLYALLLAWLYNNQRSLIFAGSTRQGTAEAVISPPNNRGELLRLRTSTNVPITSYFLPMPNHKLSSGHIVLFFYGNGSCVNDFWFMTDHFRKLGCGVMLVDYPGYGMSGGSPSEIGCYQAAEATYDYVTQVKRIPADRVVVAGWSLGSAVAIHLAANRPVAGLVTFSAFTKLSAMASRQYPIVPELISNLLLKYHFDNLKEIARVHCPTFIAHGALDDFVPPSMANELAAADHGHVTVEIVPNVAHDDILSNGGPALYDKLGRWIGELPKT